MSVSVFFCVHIIHAYHLHTCDVYCRWQCMQAPTNFPRDGKEIQFSNWLTSIRKDVEYTFGILKKRFRCLKLPFMFKDIRTIEHVFVTCCMLHNMLLDTHLSDVDPGWSRDDVSEPLFRDPVRPHIAMRANDDTNYMRLVSGFGEDDEIEVDSRYLLWRDRYIEHFYYLWVRGQVKWFGPREPNCSMRTPVKP